MAKSLLPNSTGMRKPSSNSTEEEELGFPETQYHLIQYNGQTRPRDIPECMSGESQREHDNRTMSQSTEDQEIQTYNKQEQTKSHSSIRRWEQIEYM